jgi:hypothetical protein
MNSANGDGVSISQMPDGTYEVTRINVPDEKVITYRLVPERIKAEYEAAGDSTLINAVLLEMLSKEDWKQIEHYFDVVPESTVPQGSGLELEAKLMGDPLVTAGMVCGFGFGFPDRFGAKDRTWFISKSTHSLSTGGYELDISIRDAYSFSPDGTKMPVAIGGVVQ